MRHVSGMVSRAPAHIRILGKPKYGAGCFYEPTLIADLKQDDELKQGKGSPTATVSHGKHY
jgi:betaine-aldehyde dehydrogenase